MNNGLLTERAHLGVFSTSSYINIGDQYGKKSASDPRLMGKQFSMDVPKQGIAGARPNNSMFDREHKWLYGGEKCVPCPRRARRQAERALHVCRRLPLAGLQLRRSSERAQTAAQPQRRFTAACLHGRRPPEASSRGRGTAVQPALTTLCHSRADTLTARCT